MERIKIEKIKDIPETMLIPLWAKASESKRAKSIVKDEKAKEIVSMIDYDFSKFEKSWMSQLGVSIRTMLLDNAVKDFLSYNSDAVIINLGAGLDTRRERLNNKRIYCWYDLDVAEAITFRKNFFNESPNNKFISKSVFDYSWVEDIEEENHPVLIIAEGLFMYFDEDKLKELFDKLVRRFPKAEMLFEMLSSFIVGKANIHDSVKNIDGKPEFKWGIKDTRDMENWNENIIFIEEWNYSNMRDFVGKYSDF